MSFSLGAKETDLGFRVKQVPNIEQVGELRAIAQDKQGYIWVAGHRAVLKYDGIHSRIYEQVAHFVFTDKENGIWTVSDRGLVQYDPESDNFLLAMEYDLETLFVPESESVCFSTNNNIKVALSDLGLADITPFQNVLVKRPESGQEHINMGLDRYPILCDGETTIQGYADQLFLINDTGYRQISPVTSSGEAIPAIQSIRKLSDNLLMLGTVRGIFYFDLETKIATAFNYPEQISDNVNNLFISTVAYDGKYYWTATTNSLQRITQEGLTIQLDAPHQFGSKKIKDVNQLLMDREGNMWALSPSQILFRYHSFDSDQQLQIIANGKPIEPLYIRDIKLDLAGNLWLLSSVSGVLVRAKGASQFSHFEPKGSALDSLVVSDIIASKEDDWVWLTTTRGLYKANFLLGAFEKVTPSGPDITGLPIYNILPLANGRFLLAFELGAALFDPVSNQLEVINQELFVYSAALDSRQHLYLATDSGLVEYTADKTFVSHAPIETSDPIFEVFDLHFDKQKRLLLASQSGLYLHVDGQTQEIPLFEKWPGMMVHKLYPLTDGSIWAFTGRGAFHLDADNYQVVQFLPYNKDAEFNEIEWVDNRYFVLGGFGAPLILDATRYASEAIANISWLSSPSFHSLIEPHSLSTLSLSHGDEFHAHYSSLLFADLQQVMHRHKLEGFDQQWHYTKAENPVAHYTNLPFGQYTLMVQSKSAHHGWRQDQVKIDVARPWYFHPVSYLAYVVVLLLCTLMLVRLRTAKLIASNARLESKVAARTQAVVAQKQAIEDKNKQISQLLNHKQAFYAQISHELRTPLTVMMLPISKVLGEQSVPDNYWRAAMQQGERLTAIVEHLIHFAKQGGQSLQDKVVVELIPSISQIVESMQPVAEEANKAIDLDMQIGSVVMALRHDLLDKILINLISNSIKYSGDSATITVRVSQELACINVDVEDQGPGIPNQDRDKIFEQGYRLQRDQAKIGDGIGLSTALKLAREEGGDLTLLAPQHKAGALFRLSLPVQVGVVSEKEDASQRDASLPAVFSNTDDEQCQAQPVKSYNLLIVEDNPDLGMLLKQELSSWFVCDLAENGEQGQKKVREMLPDIVLSDVMMPVMNGFELCQDIKQNHNTNHIPVVLLTAKGGKDNRISGLEKEADDYLEKPFDLIELKTRLLNLVKLRRKLAVKYRQTFFSQTNPSESEFTQDDPAQQLSASLHKILDKHFSNSEFGTSELAENLFISPRHLQRKMQNLLDMSPKELIRLYRLNRAKLLLSQNEAVTTVAYSVGFSSPAYFGSCFKTQFGMTPGQYQKLQQQPS